MRQCWESRMNYDGAKQCHIRRMDYDGVSQQMEHGMAGEAELERRKEIGQKKIG